MKSFFQIRALFTIIIIGPATILLLSAQKGDLLNSLYSLNVIFTILHQRN